MSKVQVGLSIIFVAMAAALVWVPSFSVAIGLAVTGFLFLMTGEDKEPVKNPALELASADVDWLKLEQAKLQQEINDLRSNVSKLNLGAGLKNLKKEN